ncbi:hypothetical protein GGQ11_002772 [Salinibacter ruber]|uniref:hypothetical protein n=1 Tax=Salinibacter ruber TaxID=146919 RepID=UPI00216A86AB|nr:hypothetical protein [Salinibacter ruber]MCS3657971.1 hypothetical protein [Salinibacter ruber]MCS4169872.1 hypothetical protein [Salinibacter ruber]
MSDVTLQASLAPGDWRHAQHLLPHQLRQWADQVEEILLTLDLHRSHGRFSEGWKEGRDRILRLIDDCCDEYRKAVWKEVDYSDQAQSSVGEAYFNHPTVPAKDFRGGPFYAYFFGLHAAQHSRVLHLDSDMLFGGGSQSWIAESMQLLNDHPDVLTCSPLPGPPTRDGELRSQQAARFPLESPAFRFDTLSTRIFLLDKGRFKDKIGGLPLSYPSVRDVVKAYVEGNPPYKLPEEILSEAMQRHGLWRVDMLGSPPGMWSLHPPYRNEAFYQKLPELIQRVETGDVPQSQRGRYNVHDSMVDWSSARKALKQNRWWKRMISIC